MQIDRRAMMLGGGAMAATVSLPLHSQNIETGRNRVVTNLDVKLPYLGSVRARSTGEIAGSNWLLGCETLDRDFADYDKYKKFIAPLGIKRLRMQAGWAKTEKKAGVYDFAWLDHIVNDATNRGFLPWLQTSYGNPIYPGGGGDNLGAGLPKSEEALAAYDRWVAAMVGRYREKVRDWEVWNEPNFADNLINSPEFTADFNVRTARTIKRIQPDARISGLALGHFEQSFVDRFFDRIAANRAFSLFDNMTYHDYTYNPDANEQSVALLRSSLDRYAPQMKLRQGENGAPSAGGQGGALWDYPWTELTQAKWNLRRMLGNLGQDIESSIFGLAEMRYNSGPISKLNMKGILKVNDKKEITRPKIAYYAIQNLASIFDDRLDRIRRLHHNHGAARANAPDTLFSISTDRRVAMHGYRSKDTGQQLYTCWLTENIPVDTNDLKLQTLTISGAIMEKPVWVDIVSGVIHEIPPNQWSLKNGILELREVPIYDAPVVIAEHGLIAMNV